MQSDSGEADAKTGEQRDQSNRSTTPSENRRHTAAYRRCRRYMAAWASQRGRSKHGCTP